MFALGSGANQQLLTNPQLRRAHPRDLAPPGRASVVLQQLSETERNEQEVQACALAWQSWHEQPDVRSAYGEAAAGFTRQMVERWGFAQQVDLVYVVRRLHLRILLKTMLGLETSDDMESRMLLHQWINDSASPPPLFAHVPGLARRREHRVLERIAGAVHSAGSDQFLSRLVGNRHGGERTPAAEALVQHVAELINIVEAPLTSALTWTLLLLSQHQRILSDLRAEIRASLNGAPATIDLLTTEGTHLPLLERVIKESLRLLPPRGLGLRQTTAPIELLGYALPANAIVVFSPLLTQHLANLFVSPRRFRPERWLYIEPSGDDYLPLGPEAGSCLTLSFLLLHLKLVLATLLERSRLVLAAGAQVDYRLQPVLLPKAELPMIVAPLERRLIRREVRGTVCSLVDFVAS